MVGGGPPCTRQRAGRHCHGVAVGCADYDLPRHASVALHYDFAARGATSPTSTFMPALRGLHHFVTAIFGKEPAYEHVAAHQGERLNELVDVDVAAKTVARQGHGLPRPFRGSLPALPGWRALLTRYGGACYRSLPHRCSGSRKMTLGRLP